MKERFIELIERIPDIEKMFHSVSVSSGVQAPITPVIYDVQGFTLWLEAIKYEVQEIIDISGDTYAKDTLEVLSVRFDGWSDKRKFDQIKGRLLTMRDNIEKYYNGKKTEANKPQMVFISHATLDKDYVDKIVDLLSFIGLSKDQIFCSSRPGYDIPIDTSDFIDYLQKLYNDFKLHVIIIHSQNYYKSPVCLNEMGASWVLNCKCTSILLPGFEYSGMRGVISNRSIAIKLDNSLREVKDKLNQLYEVLIQEFLVKSKPAIDWEEKRDSFIADINSLNPTDMVTKSDKTVPSDEIETDKKGLLHKASEVKQGKEIAYCPTCYEKYGKLYQIQPGSMRRDMFCTNCKAHFNR